MLVCHCKRVSCREIRRCVNEGATTAAQVSKRTAAGTDCGGCQPLVKTLVRRELGTNLRDTAA